MRTQHMFVARSEATPPTTDELFLTGYVRSDQTVRLICCTAGLEALTWRGCRGCRCRRSRRRAAARGPGLPRRGGRPRRRRRGCTGQPAAQSRWARFKAFQMNEHNARPNAQDTNGNAGSSTARSVCCRLDTNGFKSELCISKYAQGFAKPGHGRTRGTALTRVTPR